MRRTFQIAVIALLLVTLFGTSALLVSADADATQFGVGCSTFSASGTSDSPFVTLYAENESDSSYVFVVIPVAGGHYSGSVSYPAAPKGTIFDVEVWGTLVSSYATFNDPGYYDEGDYFDSETPCTQANGACTYSLPTDSVVYDVPAGAPTFFAADLSTQTNFNLPAGTWKISEFSGDFAKVWIACQATPVWIPKNAVGAAVG